MEPSTNLDNFVEKVMHLNMQHVGILGSDSSANEVILSLRQSVVAFVNERSKPTADHDTLVPLSQKIEGYLQTLQVLNTLTVTETDELIDELRALE